MGRVGIAITMSTPFRGVSQEFSNVFYYQDPAQVIKIGSSGADSLIDELVAAMKPWHSTVVSFVRGRLWWQTGDKSTTEMISTKALSGTGTIPTDSSMDKERAFLLRIRAGNDSRGNPVYLRKWFHVCCWFNSSTAETGLLQQTSAFSQSKRDSVAGLVNSIKTIGTLEEWHLCSKVGRNYDSGADFSCHKYLEHHQLGDAWRAS
jgi:hypothetical protein